jgi:predicted transcriptional regulator of viral defense system
MRAPDATLCLVAALVHHELTDEIPPQLDVALPRTARPPRVSAPVRWHRFHAETFHVGRKTIRVDQGLVLGVYDAERTLIDMFRLRHQEGEAIAIEALRRWLSRRAANPNRLLTMAKSFPMAEPELLRVLRVLG